MAPDGKVLLLLLLRLLLLLWLLWVRLLVVGSGGRVYPCERRHSCDCQVERLTLLVVLVLWRRVEVMPRGR